MRSEEEVPVTHLIVDATGFIKNAPVIDIGANIYTVAEVVREIRDKQTRERMKVLPYELKLTEPSAESMNIVRDISKKTGDYAALSATDLKLLALAHELHVRFAGKESINYAVKSIVEIADDAQEAKKEEEKVPFGFVETSGNIEKEECSDDEFGWVDETNISSVLNEPGTVEKITDKLPVAVLSSDFAIQNVLMHMKLNLISMDGCIIKTLKSYVLRCRACSTTTTNMTKKFCPKCGNDALNRIAATVTEDGTLKLHIDWQKLNNKRGLKRVQKNIKGGKHDNCDQFFEDQRMPHNRAAKVSDDPLCDHPFSMHDVSSRSAVLGIRPNRQRRR